MFDLDSINSSHKDVAALFFRIVSFFMIFIATLSGCNGYTIKPPVNSLSKTNFSLDSSQFVIVYEKEKLWGIDKSSSVIDDNSVELSIKEANKKTGYYSNPGGLEGFIGVLIGTQLVREASATSSIASMSGLGLTESHEGLEPETLLKHVFNVDQEDVYSTSDDFVSKINEVYNKDYYVLVQPRFYFSENYNSLRVNLLIDVQNKNNEIVFRNLYIFSSKPIVGDKNQCVEYWTNNKLYWFRQIATQSIADLMRLVRDDLASTNSSIIPDVHTSVRYKDIAGNHYIRGKIIHKKSNRLVIRTLRGYLKSIYVDRYL